MSIWLNCSVTQKHRTLAVVVLSLAAIGVVGCSAPPPESDSPPPATASSAEIVAECLEEAGWPATVADDGAVMVEVPKDQAEAYEAASAECWENIETTSFTDVSKADREWYYSQFVSMRQCIIELGIDLPPAPTYAVWEEMSGTWTPYVDIPQDVYVKRWEELESKCPQLRP